MINVELCSPTPEQPAQQFILDTTRKVLKPTAAPCFLCVNADEPCVLVVEANGEQIIALPIIAGPQNFRLSDLLQPAKPKQSALFKAFVPMMRAVSGSYEPRDSFTVFIRRGSPEGALIGTYSFQLLSDSEYAEAFSRYAGDLEVRPDKSVYTTDERSPDTAHDCWNCKQPLTGSPCPRCGYGPDEDAQ